MSRRPPKSELEFGSDSFLDVVANIVGILIILMVVAGVRVGNARLPVQAEDVAPTAPVAMKTETASLEADEPRPPEPVPAPEPIEPSPELLALVDSLRGEIRSLDEEIARQSRQVEEIGEAEATARRKLETTTPALKSQLEALEADRRRAADLQKQTEASRARVAALRAQLEALEKSTPAAKEIKHRLTPVSRTVEGTEIHFHLAGGRISHVPIEELIERLRSQVVRQKEWLAKFHQHQGEVGPVDGFSMRYVVERESLGVLDDVRYGGGAMMRIGVSEWQLKPEPDLRGETLAEALRPGSSFVRTLRLADQSASVTFWVYPDSFGLYRDLQQFAHEEGFTVAARPLPFGVPIAGSPHGSRSAGQ